MSLTKSFHFQALISTDVNPVEVEARMEALGMGLENLVGLLTIWEGNENMVSWGNVKNFNFLFF